MEMLRELTVTMGAVSEIREANRASPVFRHLTTVSEGISMLGWITIEPKPADFVTDTLGSSQYYGNQVLKEYKDKYDPITRVKVQRLIVKQRSISR